MAGTDKEQYLTLRRTLGQSAVAAMFPEDFEVYITAIELVDSANRVTEYFLFPLNPTSLSVSQQQIVNIKKTAGGISTTSTNTYMPSIITMNGDFGRKFKLLIGGDVINFSAFNFSKQIIKNFQNNVFSNTLKTGFGCIKVFERIIKKSSQLDQYGMPYSLHLYNLAFGESYLVKVVGQPTFNTSMDKNMIWGYSVTFQTLAPLNQIENSNDNSNLRQLGFSVVQKGLNNILSSITSSL